jgi:hypothetical protein
MLQPNNVTLNDKRTEISCSEHIWRQWNVEANAIIKIILSMYTCNISVSSTTESETNKKALQTEQNIKVTKVQNISVKST